MEGQEGMDPLAGDGRWTCDACGCHTNTAANSMQCNICGTHRREIPAFLRRAGRSAASRLLAHHYNFAREHLDDDEVFDEDNMEVQFGAAMMGIIDPEEQAVAALALEVAGIRGAAMIPGAHSLLSRRQPLLNAPAHGGEDDRNFPPPEPPETLWRLALENAEAYQPKWSIAAQRGGKSRHNHDIDLGALQNVARIADGALEGCAVRASEPLPRATHRAHRDYSNRAGQASHQRKVYGFRVVFDHPYREPGRSLGDCYLIGVTTSSFSAYGERNGLMQSPYFWGIEDSGTRFEGPRRRLELRPSTSSYGIETSSRDLPRNADNVLFGARETVSVVVDLENKSMSFWRDDDFLGTLVRNLPRSGYLYPVVVPFNAGATFAITGMDRSPLPCVERFNSYRREREDEKANRCRQERAEKRAWLIQNGMLSPRLIAVLKKIFSAYSSAKDNTAPREQLLGIVAASRLWYRSGLSLSELCSLVEEKVARLPGAAIYDNVVSTDDFLECINGAVKDDIAVSDQAQVICEVGDKVELVDCYAKFGDAMGGPLQTGDRGTVIEVKQEPNQEPYAIHVTYNDRQWWYEPQALNAERSGLVDSPSVWFLHKVLRSHGYDQNTLEPLWGKPLSTSWEVGDLVVPRTQPHGSTATDEIGPPSTDRHCFGRIVAETEDEIGPPSTDRHCFGRIVAETKDSLLSTPVRGRRNTVLVEFAVTSFGSATGVPNEASEITPTPSLQVRRIPIVKLRYPDNFFGPLNSKNEFNSINQSMSDAGLNAEQVLVTGRDDGGDEGEESDRASLPKAAAFFINSKLRSEVEAVSCLDPTAIQSVARTCESRPSLSASVFASGLCDAILSAVSLAEQNVARGKINDGMRAAVSSLGLLASILCERLFSANDEEKSAIKEWEEIDQNADSSLSNALAAVTPLTAVLAEEDLASETVRSEVLDPSASRRMLHGADMSSARQRGHMFRTRARHINSTSSRSAKDEWNTDGQAPSDARSLIYNGLLMNSLPWVKAGLQSAHDGTTTNAGLDSFSNARDKDGMSLLLLAVVLGCTTDVVHHLLLSDAIIGKTEIQVAALTNQPNLLAVLLQQHSVCPKQLIESLQVSPEVAAIFEAAEARQKIQEEVLCRKADMFASTLIVRLCRLGLVCRSGTARIRCFGRAVSEALVGNVLLRALNENQQKALAAASPRRRKHGGSAQPARDSESERLSLSDPWGVGDSEVYASAAAMSPKHGVFLVCTGRFFWNGFLCGPPQTQNDRLSVLLSFVESLLWSKEKEDAAAGLTILRSLLVNVPLVNISPEIERYGLADLILTHELIAGQRLADIMSRQIKTKAILGSTSEAMADGNRANKKRPRGHLAANTSNAGDVVLCPKSHVAELHLTKHSSFRCDICGKGVLRDRPMHGCRECDWDACENCMDQNEGGTVKWGCILELTASCRKMLENSDAALKSSDGLNRMNLEESLMDSRGSVGCRDLSRLARQLRLQDESALTDLASKMESSDYMTNHEFVSFILAALHAALVDKHEVTPQKDRFFLHAIRTFTAFDEEKQQAAPLVDDDSHMSIDDIPSHEEDHDNISIRDASPRENVALVNGVSSSALRRLQDILAFSENMRVLHAFRGEKDDSKSISPTGSSLQSLVQPIELHISPMNAPETASDSTVFVEPLLPTKELQLHVIRACRILDPSYLAFCRSLAKSNAVIVERRIRNGQEENSPWQIAQVVGFDEDTGSHSVRYPSTFPDEMRRSDQPSRVMPFEGIKFNGGKGRLVIAAREYYILHRSEYKSLRRGKSAKMPSSSPQSADRDDNASLFPPEVVPTGTRVESNCSSPDHVWLPCTVVSRSAGRTDVRYDIVSDHGEVFCEVGADQIRGYKSSCVSRGADGGVPRNLRDALDPEPARNALRRGGALPFPFFRMGRNVAEQRAGLQRGADARSTPEIGVLKRTWSALSPLNDMCPLEIVLTPESQTSWEESGRRGRSWRCSIGGEDVDIFVRDSAVELPPKLWVDFSAHGELAPVDVSTCHGEAVVHMLHRLLQRHDETRNEGSLLFKKHRLYYNVRCEFDSSSTASWVESASAGCASHVSYNEPDDGMMAVEDCFQADLQGISEWLDGTSLQCMEVMNVLASFAEEAALSSEERSDLYGDSSEPRDKINSLLSSFENEALSQKLRDQLEDPLMVVGGVLPDWCLKAPSIAPRVFSYSSRRQLLLRTAFGVSRSTLKQQEAKVAVGPLRQRMSTLRGRAVELMGEAFSGNAEDPTVLQLQADELYGMEEALAARVSSAFRAQRWQERSLRCAKAAVRRCMLLSDAAALMERYANDERLRHRRLEVRFDGESGFDAASGDEAGVTRGFYADVAEALVSCDHIATVYCPASCLDDASLKSFSDYARMSFSEQCRLPLWIPDIDSSRQIVITTPRASPNSALGVYPRPLSPDDPLLPRVRQRFRFMGRLFAAAMRDNLMFPLQLSTSFLKLVQNPRGDTQSTAVARASYDSKVISNHVAGSKYPERSLLMRCAQATLLTSDDLPRPGFLGGEVYAVEMHICASLDRIDESEPSLSPFEADAQRHKIASDCQFARLALGKAYDCSFNEYFEDRTFVDPLSPTQGEDAAPLCPGGHLRQVSIHNVREWVHLAKKFILHDGVVEQALAFKRGVDDFFPSEYLSIFTASELQRDVCGGGDKVDRWTEDDIRILLKFDGGRGVTEALVAVAAMGGEGGASLNRRFGSSSPTIGYLVRTLLESSPTQRRQFLSFTTSVPIVTPGKIEVVPMVSPMGEFLPMRDPGCLPRANTCARRLYLPRFEDYETFSQVLRAVIREESKFKGFYEWRG